MEYPSSSTVRQARKHFRNKKNLKTDKTRERWRNIYLSLEISRKWSEPMRFSKLLQWMKEKDTWFNHERLRSSVCLLPISPKSHERPPQLPSIAFQARAILHIEELWGAISGESDTLPIEIKFTHPHSHSHLHCYSWSKWVNKNVGPGRQKNFTRRGVAPWSSSLKSSLKTLPGMAYYRRSKAGYGRQSGWKQGETNRIPTPFIRSLAGHGRRLSCGLRVDLGYRQSTPFFTMLQRPKGTCGNAGDSFPQLRELGERLWERGNAYGELGGFCRGLGRILLSNSVRRIGVASPSTYLC